MSIENGWIACHNFTGSAIQGRLSRHLLRDTPAWSLIREQSTETQVRLHPQKKLHHSSLRNIQNAKHTNKLKDAGYITLNIDLIQMGVGGNDSWSDVAAPLEQYQIKAQPYHYSFYIVPFNSKIKGPETRAKEIKF